MEQNQFIKLIEEHSGIIHTITNLYTDSDQDKEDLKQEILLQSWKSITNFKKESKFSTWLYRLSLNTAITFLKKEKKHKDSIKEASYNRNETEYKNEERSELLFNEIKKLSDVDKLIITLHLEGYKNHEISDIININTNHLTVKLHRIKEHIINNLKIK